VRRLALSPLGRAAATLLAVAPIALLLATGSLDELAVLKEYATKRDTFGAAVLQHARIVLAAFIPAVAIGLPLGVWAHRSTHARGTLLAVLNIVQTVPSIALFGLLMAPLSYVARHVPWVAEVGISGIGLAPAAVALVLYSLLPLVRNTAAGLDGVPTDAIDAAEGMGMNRWQVLTRIEIPLAFPVILSGLRITLVQAIGLAAVAALIGAGGLGAIMFQGLFANATAQILLGTVPIVVMAVGIDILFRLVAAAWQPGRS
jgi:osmoprotectant transport system permease protein